MTTDPKALVTRLCHGDLHVPNWEIVDAIQQLQRERDANEAKAQVMHDLHDALGVPWGDNPYARINALKAAETALAAATAEREGFVEWIVRRGRELPDHAFEQCVPYSEIIVKGWSCIYHRALKLSTLTKAKGATNG